MLKTLYLRWIYPHPRLHTRLLPLALFVRFLLQHVQAMPRQLLQVDLIRWAICLPRFLIVFVLFRRYRLAPDLDAGVTEHTIAHNMRGAAELAAPRSHILLRPIATIDSVARHVRDRRVLSIGPRVEGEMYNLMGYGFRRRHIVGLDLFSYSPMIQVGNMHAMPFPDASFDVVISGWVMAYSNDPARAAAEMRRVCRPGGVIAMGVAYSGKSMEDVERRTGFAIGVSEMVTGVPYYERLFGVRPEDIYFRYDGGEDKIEGAPIVVIFRNNTTA